MNGEHPKTVRYASGIKYVHWSTYMKTAYWEWQKTKELKNFLNKVPSGVKEKKVSDNMQRHDWKLLVAKIFFELTDRGKTSDVWN